MQKKINVGILFGGQSVEHEISLLSAQNVVAALNTEKYQPVLIGITKQGQWIHYSSLEDALENKESPAQIALRPSLDRHIISHDVNQHTALIAIAKEKTPIALDVVFPVLHGANGEDGTMQGLLRLAGIPFVGSDVLGSAIAMDKDVTKRLLLQAGIRVAPYLVFQQRQRAHIQYAAMVAELGLPFFVKPANTGSSIGISKVKKESEFARALDHAFTIDRKIVCEAAISGREIECAVLGNTPPRASIPGEIITRHEFYSYEAKYLDPQGAQTRIADDLSAEHITQIQQLACHVFCLLECVGMARVDFFLTPAGELYVNEVNTIPGFTQISMYPQLWAASGITYPQLIDQLIELALERAQ